MRLLFQVEARSVQNGIPMVPGRGHCHGPSPQQESLQLYARRVTKTNIGTVATDHARTRARATPHVPCDSRRPSSGAPGPSSGLVTAGCSPVLPAFRHRRPPGKSRRACDRGGLSRGGIEQGRSSLCQ